MSASFEAILLSRSFTFIVGPDEVPIVVHEAAFADQSPELAALTRGEMSEGLAGEAKWDDVDEGTFVRFSQFAYTGDYSTPRMIVKPSDPSGGTPLEDTPLSNGWGLGTGKKDKKKGKEYPPRPPSPIPAFKTLSYPLPVPRFNFADTWDPTIGDGPSENIDEILLIHASLYVLAEKWGIDKLKRLALFKIHKTLSLFSLDSPKFEHIIHFVRYAYSDERTPDLKTKIDELRELICQYVAANAEFTSRDTAFLALVEEGGAFARDLWKIVAPRVRK